MSNATAAELNEIVERIRRWEPESRVLLVRRVLETLESSSDISPPRRLPLEQVYGLLKSDGPSPTDEEVRGILEEERVRKHL